MKITLNPVLDIETLQWVSNDDVFDYFGPIVSFGGPSADATANEAAQTAFYQVTTQQQQQTYAEQQSLYNTVVGATAPIIAKGPQQYGYTPEVDALLRSQITDTANQATANAVTGTELREQQKTGGTDIMGTGGQAQLEATENVLGEQSKAQQLSAEKLSGYQAGQNLYSEAMGALSGVTGNPTAYTSAATGAGSGATSAINLADSERSTLLTTLLSGAIGAGTTMATGGANKALGL